MHSECNHQKAKEVGMSQQPQWDVWPSGSPDLPDSLVPEQEVALLSSTEDCGKQIQLPKQLEAVRKASEFPFERHRWNTNEEVAAILIAFDKHESWEKQEVRTRPPSGTMLLYSRKKVRYRKDGYCWKKRKDGKTTREDHMKLKVQGIECIYGSYVHSAILPTFHRRCYWLLQNPDLVLVHYLNVPLTDDNKICLPPILQVDCKDWSHDDLVSQLRPMFASVKHFETASNVNETAEDAIESLVKHILGSSASSSASNPVHLTAGAMPRTTVETPRNTSDQKMALTSAPNTMQNRLLQLIYSHKISPGAASASVPCVVGAAGHQQMSPSQIGLAVCEPNNGTTVLRGLKSNTTLSAGHKVSPHNGPLILNVSPLPGSKGLLILSSQAATSSKGTLSVLHQAPVGSRIDVVTSKEATDSSASLQVDYSDLAKKNFQPLFSGLGSENVRARCESTAIGSKAAPCYGVVSDFLNHSDILGEFDLQQVIKTEAKDGQLRDKTAGHIPDFSSGSCVAEFSRGSCVREPSSVDESDAHDLNQIGMDSMEFLFGDSGLTDPPSSMISENDIKCEFYNFHESSSPEVGNHGNTETIGSGAPAGSSCMADTMDTSLTGHEKDLDDMKALHGNDLMMDELEDILHIVSESLGSSVDLTNTFSLSDDPGSSTAAMSSLYQCANISGSSLSGSHPVLSVNEKLKTCLNVVQNETLSTNENHLFCSESGKVGLLEITDYCPEWSYTEGGTKVLVTGPWHQTSSSYSVLFDELSVPTSMVQGGVLRCFAPAHSPAVVCLRVAYNGQIISEPKVFEYKSRDQVETGNETDWFLVQERQLKESLVQRFVEVEKSLMDDQAASLSTSIPLKVTESCLVGLVDRLSERPSALHCSPPVESPTRMTLLHLSAALGFNRLLSALIKWRNNNTCLVLEQEVDSLSVDSKGNTPLMWACARGHLEAVMVLAHWSPSSLHKSNKTNWRPMTILEHFGHRSIIELLQQITTSGQTSFLDSLTTLEQSDSFRQLLTDENFNGSAKSATATDYVSLDGKPVFSQLFSSLPSAGNDAVTPTKREFPPPCDSSKDSEYWRAVDAPLQHSLCSPQVAPLAAADVSDSDTCPPVLIGSATKGSGALKRTRLMKRTSVDILPDYPQFHNDLPKLSRTGAHPDGDEDGDTFEGQGQMGASREEHAYVMAGLRASSSDPHLTNLERSSPLGSGSGGDPMISRIDRDLNSPVLFLQTSASFDEDKGLSLEDIQRETVAMDMDSPDNLEGLSRDDGSEMLQSASVEADDHSNQMMTLASQIIAAMPERIKISPSHSKHLLMDEINSRRDRTSSYGSFSSCSSSTPPVCITEDSGISTPLEGMSFLEYRYSDIGTPTSTLSPTSTCMQSPYSFGLDSPPPTAAEFTEYFNAPAMYMEKDFSQLTLSDEEQRRLYEAAKIIQNFYRKYKDKKEQQMRQQQKEIEAAILIQSYYRRYKQFMYYKRMTQAAVLIQSQFRSYYAQKCFKRSREAATIIQNRYRAYKEHERYKKSRNAAVIIQQRFRSHYQRTLAGRQSSLASTVHKMMADSDVSSDTTDAREPDIGDTNPNQNSSEQEAIRVRTTTSDDVKTSETVATTVGSETLDCSSCTKEIPSEKDDETRRL